MPKNNSTSASSKKGVSKIHHAGSLASAAALVAAASAPVAEPKSEAAQPVVLSKNSSITAQVGFIDMSGKAHDKFETAVLTNAKALMMSRLSSYFKSRGMRMEAESIAQLIFGVDQVDDIKTLDDVLELRLILDETLAYHDRELELKPTHIEAN